MKRAGAAMKRAGRLAIGLCAVATLGATAHAGRAAAQGTTTRGATTTPIRVAPSRASGALGPLVNIAQTWNNCGPASIAEVLAYWGIDRTQGQVQAVLRVDGPDRGMVPYGVPSYARGLGLRALVGVGGTEALVKALISNGFPVIANQQVSVTNHIGHYRPIEAYDDRQGVFVASDPYLGDGYRITYADFKAIWARGGDGFMVLYPPSRQGLLAATLAAAGWDKTRAYRAALATERARQRHMDATIRQVVGQAGQAGRGLPRGFAGYRSLTLAWDELEAGDLVAARRDLAQATRQRANPIEVRWIAGEMPA